MNSSFFLEIFNINFVQICNTCGYNNAICIVNLQSSYIINLVYETQKLFVQDTERMSRLKICQSQVLNWMLHTYQQLSIISEQVDSMKQVAKDILHCIQVLCFLILLVSENIIQMEPRNKEVLSALLSDLLGALCVSVLCSDQLMMSYFI